MGSWLLPGGETRCFAGMHMNRPGFHRDAFQCTKRRFGAAKSGFGARGWVGGLHRTELRIAPEWVMLSGLTEGRR